MKKISYLFFVWVLTLLVGCAGPGQVRTSDGVKDLIKVTNKMDQAISKSIIQYNKNAYLPIKENQPFEVHKIYGATKKKSNVYEVYIYTIYEQYNKTKKEVVSGGIVPVLITLKKENGNYKMVGYKEAEDGADNLPSIKKMFPIKFAREAITNVGVSELKREIKTKINNWAEKQK